MIITRATEDSHVWNPRIDEADAGVPKLLTTKVTFVTKLRTNEQTEITHPHWVEQVFFISIMFLECLPEPYF